MAEDLTKGLNVLLHPKFTELSQRLDRLEIFHKDLSAVVAVKEERHEVERLRDHMDAQYKQIEGIISVVKDKMLSLDQLRSQEMRAMAKNLDAKAPLAQMKHLDDQLQVSNMTMSGKADIAKLEQVAKQIHVLSQEMALKSTAARVDGLAKQVQVLHDALAKKVDFDTTNQLAEHIRNLSSEVAAKAFQAKQDELDKRLETLAGMCAVKAEHASVEQLDRQVRLLGEEVAARADVRKVEHLTRQLHVMHEELAQKAEVGSTDQALRQIHALSDAVAVKVEDQRHGILHDQVAKLREDVFSMRGEFSKLDDHARQLESLHSSVSLDSARVKHLCLMYQSSAATKDLIPSTPSTTAPGSPAPAYTHRPRNLPSMGSSSGTQKPGSVMLPTMSTGSPSTSGTPYPKP